MTIAAVVLAAGSGSRWEGPDHKLVHPFRGKPLISWSLEAPLEADFDEFIVVTGSANLTPFIPERYTEIHNPHWELGQATSLKSAVDYAESMNHESLVIGLGDTPLVDSQSWKQVLQQPEKLVCASYEGKRRPPFKIHRDFWQELPVEVEQCARNGLNSTTLPVVEVSCGGWPDDIDTVEDLKKWN